jgi:N-acetylmuramoyl-L-alanine amidase
VGESFRVTHLILHCSDSPGGCASLIDADHREHRGFSSIGYHYVVQNGRPDWGGATYELDRDGVVEKGRPDSVPGAHCLGYNETSLGICLVGGWRNRIQYFTPRQFAAAYDLIGDLMLRYRVPLAHVLGHCETASGMAQGKTCPVFDVIKFREDLAGWMDQASKGLANV